MLKDMYWWRYVLLIIGAVSAAPVYAAAAIEDIGNRPPPSTALPATVPSQSISVPTSGANDRGPGGGQAVLELMRRNEELQIEVQNLRGELEGMYSNLEAVKNRQREMFLDLDRRMQEVEAGVRGGVPPGTSANGGPPGVPSTAPNSTAAAPSVAPVVDMAAARQAYERAFGLLRDQKYEPAITEFERFLAQFGQSEYAVNAQYWLGEANYAARRYEQAATAFKNVTTQFPTSGKVADAYLKLGFAYYELAKWAEARQALGAVKAQFPNSSAARLAQDRLNRMVQEGH